LVEPQINYLSDGRARCKEAVRATVSTIAQVV
jgi:hypothetical protein